MNGTNITIAIAVGLALLAFFGIARADRTDCTLMERIDDGSRYWDCNGEIVESERDNHFVDDFEHRQADRICRKARRDRNRYFSAAERDQVIIACEALRETKRIRELLEAADERDRKRWQKGTGSGITFEFPFSSSGGVLK